MKNIIYICDFYKKPITLPIESQNKYSITLGFIITIITFIVFVLHFYFESYEVFARINPTVSSIRNNIQLSNKANLKISNQTLKLFINISVNKENALDYFYIDSYYLFFSMKTQIKFKNCTSEDFANLSKDLKSFYIPDGINLCPEINFLKYYLLPKPEYDFDKFYILFSLDECYDESFGCKQDKDFYERLRNGTDILRARVNFINSQEDMLNDANPFVFNLFECGHSRISTTVQIDLEASEIITQPLFGLFDSRKDSQFKVSGQKVYETPWRIIGCKIFFDLNNLTFYFLL
jgi:hypothetical protein